MPRKTRPPAKPLENAAHYRSILLTMIQHRAEEFRRSDASGSLVLRAESAYDGILLLLATRLNMGFEIADPHRGWIEVFMPDATTKARRPMEPEEWQAAFDGPKLAELRFLAAEPSIERYAPQP